MDTLNEPVRKIGTNAERLALAIPPTSEWDRIIYWTEDNGDEYALINGTWLQSKVRGVNITSQASSSGIAAEYDADGAALINGLADNAIRVPATTTYNTNKIKGFRVLLKGTGTLTFTPDTAAATPIVVTAAEITEMGATAYNDWPIACSSLTAGTGMEVMVYI